MRLARYAGFDPAEDDFEGIEMAPLHQQDERQIKTKVDIRRASELKNQGRSWAEVGRIIAAEMGRRVPYQPEYVSLVANKLKP